MIKLMNRMLDNLKEEWADVAYTLMEHLQVAYQDRELLLRKFNYPTDTELVPQLLNNRELTEINLTKHKMLIKMLIGQINQKDAKQDIISYERVKSENLIRTFLLDWDIIQKDITLKVCN